MLIVVGLLFLVLTLPADIYFLVYSAFPASTPEDEAIEYLMFAVTSLLFYSNSAFNFIFYFISGQKFRTAFCAIICCGRCRGDRGSVGGRGNSKANGRRQRVAGAAGSEMAEDISMTIIA